MWCEPLDQRAEGLSVSLVVRSPNPRHSIRGAFASRGADGVLCERLWI
jgi:hypothetical protein